MSLLHRHVGVVCLAAAGLLLAACGSGPAKPSATPTATPTTSASVPPSSPSTAPAAPATGDYTLPTGYVPLYPFADSAQVQAWVTGFQSGGHQPWHLDADLTALAFAQGYLGYGGISRAGSLVNGSTSRDAHLQVGYTNPNGHLSVAAVVHLVRFGTGPDAPWEVVGTDDTTFTLDNPVYNTTASSPVQVGGRITGADESIRVQVRQLGAQAPVGTFCCQPAGGTDSPWSVTVTFHASPGQVVTIAAATGGHLAGVERFAITGITVG